MLTLKAEDIAAYGDALVIRTREAGRILAEVESGKEYDLTLKRHRKKRSLDSNAYAWTLIDRIAATMGLTKTEVYQRAIREIGGNSDIVCVLEKAANALCDGWSHNGLGWFAERTPSKIDGCVNVILYYGSSTYDTATMSRLIDNLIADAKELGIETMTPQELARLEGYGA